MMLFVQAADLHMHNHEVLDQGAFTVHAVGGQQHAAAHDQSGEIDLSFSTLLAKSLMSLDVHVVYIFLLLLLPLFFFRLRCVPEPPPRLYSLAFRLRPPSRASPL